MKEILIQCDSILYRRKGSNEIAQCFLKAEVYCISLNYRGSYARCVKHHTLSQQNFRTVSQSEYLMSIIHDS